MKYGLIEFLGVVVFFGSCSNSAQHVSQNADKKEGIPVMDKQLSPFCSAEKAPFYHGVASGDPLPNAVVIWTRITPNVHETSKVEWQVSLTNTFEGNVKKGIAETNAERDYTVKIDVKNLRPSTYYFYRFKYKNKYSVVGRTKTAPTGPVHQLRLAFASCSNYAWGYFNAYRLMANDTLDAVIHLGDYIYEHEQNTYQQHAISRRHIPNKEIISLSDYRTRYAQYRLDDDLQKVHAAHPFITIWDDHELANNAYDNGAQNHQPNEGDWNTRLAAAKKAYYEWMPVRENNDHLYRSFQFGDLLNLCMLDTRVEGRSVQQHEVDLMADSSRKIMDETQFKWLVNEMGKNTLWKIIGNQVLLGSMKVFFSKKPEIYTDGWEGYPYQREKLLQALLPVKNVVILTGDFHSSFALRNGYLEKQVAHEFVVPSITSANYDEDWGKDSAMVYKSWYMQQNPNLDYVNLVDHGYVTITITRSHLKASFIFVDNVIQKAFKKRPQTDFTINLQ